MDVDVCVLVLVYVRVYMDMCVREGMLQCFCFLYVSVYVPVYICGTVSEYMCL